MFCCLVFLPSELVAAYYVIEKVDLKFSTFLICAPLNG